MSQTKKSRYQTTQALVLHQKSNQEKDKTIHLFTPDLGLIRPWAKGSQSLKSRRLSLLNTGNLIQVKLYINHSIYLSEGKILNSFDHLRGDLDLLNQFYLLLFTIKNLYINQPVDALEFNSIFNKITNSLAKTARLAKNKTIQTIDSLIIYQFLNSGFIKYPFICSRCGQKTYHFFLNYDLEPICLNCNSRKAASWTTPSKCYNLKETKSRHRLIYSLIEIVLNKEFKPIK